MTTLRSTLATWTDRVFGPRCIVTGDRVFPADRRAHEGTEHPTDGPCDG